MESQLVKLSEHIYYLPSPNRSHRPILSVVIGNDQVMFIDAGASVCHMEQMLEEFKKLGIHTRLPKIGVLTHSHWDHVFGMQTCDFIYVSHRLTKEYMDKMFLEDFSTNKALRKIGKNDSNFALSIDKIRKEWAEPRNIVIQIPCILYRHQLDIDLGGIGCKLEHIESDHCDDSTVIYVEEDKVLFLGDCMEYGYKDGVPIYTKLLIEVIDIVLSYDVDYYVFSHHNKIMNKASFIEYCEYLKLVGATVSNHYHDKEKIEQELGNRLSKEDKNIMNAFIEGRKGRIL